MAPEVRVPRGAKKRRACDRCVRRKKACSAGWPCDDCRRKLVSCTYQRRDETKKGVQGQQKPDAKVQEPVPQPNDTSALGGDPTPSSSTDETLDVSLIGNGDCGLGPFSDNLTWLDFLDLDQTMPLDQPQSDQKKGSFDFLYTFTSRTGLVESFDCGTLAQRVQTVSEFLQDEAARQAKTALFNDPLITVTRKIVAEIHDLSTNNVRRSAAMKDNPSTTEQSCLQFFSPLHLRKFLALFWNIWHPNCPFIHRQSFDPTIAKPCLVAAMAVTGASVSPEPTDNELARTWFNSVEEMVFSDDAFCDDAPYCPLVNPVEGIDKIQALQAGYLAARDVGVSSARHRNYDLTSSFDDFDWQDFIAREQLIRVVMWTFMFDKGFVLFNNIPPRMVIKEMTMHIAWPDSIFQAGTAAECAREIQAFLSRSSSGSYLTLCEVFERYCKDKMDPNLRRVLVEHGASHLFAIILAVYSTIFQHQNSLAGFDQLGGIRNALDNWKSTYEAYLKTVPISEPYETADSLQDMWRRPGFSRHAHEFYLVARALVSRMSSGESVPGMDGSKGTPGFNEYDQTSMRQLNDLITDFLGVHLD
ncbi:uncharacterized protein NECHADRAFT_52033 [Fusarium vanettenii 77-13-4]|uniref:Zn(2)-C6 fungal-type domain-containing protein n=1 Tax=Fusarium vanettenii (strain ATCC MYA-4622 / CBS 123669 / FGSC 9596 / NRRL 45880 / 77-13-4) TaxID=660122 RepID=C7ZFX7_FUSV7|nr:uncharacterized protein NECHADRAFT_52033 [Fusarium vanettenii 77-13-4]EEU37054.1 hypothetical protein NECHADRAFT_52033 [Fusarium vanettenii 77-13-4]